MTTINGLLWNMLWIKLTKLFKLIDTITSPICCLSGLKLRSEEATVELSLNCKSTSLCRKENLKRGRVKNCHGRS